MKLKYWLAALGLLLTASVATAASVRIITQRGMLREEKRFFAPVIARIPYAESLHVLGSEGDWLRVYYQNKYGWIHRGEVNEQKFTLSVFTGESTGGATQDEVALAGKGFTPQVEKVFRQRNPDMQFVLVDQVESLRISDKKIQTFLEQGNLKDPGGAP